MADSQTILILDDDISTLMLLNEILKQEGYETLTAASISEAAEIIRSEKFDLAVLDLNLPDGSGLDLCKLMKNMSKTAEIPALFLSADTDIKNKVLGFEAGAVDYITKPFSRIEVLARIKTHLRLHKAYHEMIEYQAFKLSQVANFQKSILPQPDTMPDAKFNLYYQPLNEAGGDLCQVFPIAKSIHDYIVADVCGHSFGDAMSTSALYALLKQNCSALYTPYEIVNTINYVTRSFLSNGQFITAIYARINRKTGQLSIVNAGNPPAILIKDDGMISMLRNDGDVIGAFETVNFGHIEIKINKGDKLFLFSDAILDALTISSEKTDWETGLELLSSNLNTIKTLPVNEIVEKMSVMAKVNSAAIDDITIVGIEI